MSSEDPHRDIELVRAGAPPTDTRLALVLLHGRGSTPEDILELAPLLAGDHAERVAFVAPRAAGGTWYPRSFLAPLAANAPWLASAHRAVARVLADLEEAGVPAERCGLVGFSQGACLAVDHALRHPRRHTLVAAFTGGFVGPPGTAFAPRDDAPLAGTPVFLGANAPDPHVPWERVIETADAARAFGASVETVEYPGAPHAVNHDELRIARGLVADALARPPA